MDPKKAQPSAAAARPDGDEADFPEDERFYFVVRCISSDSLSTCSYAYNVQLYSKGRLVAHTLFGNSPEYKTAWQQACVLRSASFFLLGLTLHRHMIVAHT